MNYILIDTDVQKYQPQLILSQIDWFEYNVNKFKKVYVYIDDINILYKLGKINENIIFIIDKDIVIESNKFIIKKINYNRNLNYDFKKKICKHEYIYNWLFSKAER